ncbi:MAG: hypothetical protein RL088_3293 [Verrucomicrobiota bacterium]|jgi:RNA polymerase sigma-70 factor (ECF subfamily)
MYGSAMEFPTTQWTQIAAASLNGEGRAAMDTLCKNYYAPIRRFVGWKRGWQDAEDVTQAFFFHLMEKGIVRNANRLRGKFRTFLLTVLSRFMIHYERAQLAEKRGGSVEILSLDDIENEPEADTESALLFDKEWAVAVMDAAAAKVGDEIQRERGGEAFDVLKRFLGVGQEPQTYETAATLLELSLPAVKSEIMRWRRRLGEIVRGEVGRTVSTPQEVEEEIAHLRRVLLE